MNTKRDISATRAVAIILLAVLTVILISTSFNAKMKDIVTSLRPLAGAQGNVSLRQHLTYEDTGEDVYDVILEADKKYDIDRGFIKFCANSDTLYPDGDFLSACRRYITQNGYNDEMWETLTGITFSVLYDIYTGRISDGSVTVLGDVYDVGKTTLAFTGDMNLGHDSWAMTHMRAHGGSIENCISKDLITMMQDADFLFVNNEFSISDRGEPLKNKMYTFRADPDDLSIFRFLGVDMVSLANNHVYDYGPDAFSDTMKHIDEAGILRVGAGENEAEASEIRYVISGGVKLAFCAASSAEVHRMTPVADGEKGGVMGIYDTEKFLRVIKEADANADIVIAYVHFGKENSNALNDVQVAAAHSFVDAGADIVIGAHPHVLQPVEYYNGVPIVYSLGNFWFNSSSYDTAFLTISVSVGITPVLRLYPCMMDGGDLSLADKDDAARIIGKMNSWSKTADIGDDNRIRER